MAKFHFFFIFAKLRNILSDKILIAVYHGLFNSIATYGIIAWGSAYDNALDPLISIQKKIFKLLNFTHDRLPLSINQSYKLNSLIYNFKNLKNKFKQLHGNTIDFAETMGVNRNRTLPLPRNKLEIGKKNYQYTSTLVFNDLPLDLKIYFNTNNIRPIKTWIKNNI